MFILKGKGMELDTQAPTVRKPLGKVLLTVFNWVQIPHLSAEFFSFCFGLISFKRFEVFA